jgi:soluble cytochrome b562
MMARNGNFNQLMDEAAQKQRHEVYLASLEAVGWIDEKLRTGRMHFRDGDGRLIETLDDAVRALDAGKLAVSRNGHNVQ